MELKPAPAGQDVRYEPDEPCPTPIALGVAGQGVLLMLAPVVVNVSIVFRTADQSENYLSWAVFAALVVGGTTTALQALRLERIGAGHLIITGPGPVFIAICITALAQGGPALMASLVVVSALFQFVLAAWLPLLRRIITPVVSGVVVMLIASTVVPIALRLLDQVPGDASAAAGPCVAAVTLAVATGLALRASGAWRLWSPLMGILAGCAAAVPFGLYDIQRVLEAPWIGMPDVEWHGLELTPSAEFWSLLPVFVIVTLVVAINSISDGIAIQSASRRNPGATDFRIVQGALNANAVGVLMSGFAGTMPTMGYTAGSTSLISLTGVAARSVGLWVGAILAGLAFLPKLTALLLIIPGPVAGVYFILMLALLFVAGARMILQEGFDFRNATIAGLAFWIGVGAQNQAIFAEHLRGAWSTVFGNGMTVGAFTAIALTLFVELTGSRRRLEVELNISALPKIDAFLRQLASKLNWNEASTQRLCAVGDETLSSLLHSGNDSAAGKTPRLLLVARANGRTVEMEFVAVFDEASIEDRLAYLSEQPEDPDESEISFRLLRHYASSVRHRKYYGIDIVTVRVEGSRRG